MARAASPEPSTVALLLPVNGSWGPVGTAAAVLRPVLRDGVLVRRLGAIASGWGAWRTVAGPRTDPRVVVVVLVDVVELVDVVLVELVGEVEVDVVVADGRNPVAVGAAGVVAGEGRGAAPAATAPIEQPRSPTASAAVAIALRRNGCGSVTGPPWARATREAPTTAHPRAR
jgi:hypothetical protein